MFVDVLSLSLAANEPCLSQDCRGLNRSDEVCLKIGSVYNALLSCRSCSILSGRRRDLSFATSYTPLPPTHPALQQHGHADMMEHNVGYPNSISSCLARRAGNDSTRTSGSTDRETDTVALSSPAGVSLQRYISDRQFPQQHLFRVIVSSNDVRGRYITLSPSAPEWKTLPMSLSLMNPGDSIRM